MSQSEIDIEKEQVKDQDQLFKEIDNTLNELKKKNK